MKRILSYSITLAFAIFFGAGVAHGMEPEIIEEVPRPEIRRYAEITQPKEDAKRHGTVAFRAFLVDDDFDYVDWAVREGTCAAATNTVFGNVDGHSDPYKWVKKAPYMYKFVAKADTSTWDAGMYCFVFNPREDSGEAGIRLTREFFIADGRVNGGGVLLEHREIVEFPDIVIAGHELLPMPKPFPMPETLKVTFGGDVWDLGNAGYMGNMRFKLHNVGDDAFDKGRFKSTEITDMNFFDGTDSSCVYAMNMTMRGTYNGMPGYTAIYRAGDSGTPGNHANGDTVRFELWKDGLGRVYDTHNPGEFSDESHCVGTARTGLDKGNLRVRVF